MTLFKLLLFVGLVASSFGHVGKKKKWPNTMDAKRLAWQVMIQQFYAEEVSRSQGQSGFIYMRQRGMGTKPYHGTSHSDDSTIASLHDHPDHVITCGLGEQVVNMNGVTFKTRHNDYRLVRRGGVGAGFDDLIPIPYPDVPPSVLALDKVDDQIEAMKYYFKAFVNQDTSVVDYRPYFKPHLCYMQGAWTYSDLDEIQEAFPSRRHGFCANTWRRLFYRHSFEVYSGTKDNLENAAFMPTKLWNVEDDGTLEFAQWNYKILCHQLDEDLPLNRLRGVDDLKTRVSMQVSYEEALTKRNARFQVNPDDSDEWKDGPKKWGLLDELMEQIPGPDGYGANLQDDSYNALKKQFNTEDDTPMNAAYFHRWYQNQDLGAMGAKVRLRSMLDENIWMAMTTQPNVVPTRLELCENGDCQTWEQRWVFALPMEMVYTTPLHNWNPYDIEYHGDVGTPAGDSIFDGPGGTTSRDGSWDPDKAFNGINSVRFYRTPYEFFEDLGEYNVDLADTPKPFRHVLDSNGIMRKVRASGVRTIMPSIPGLGRVRQRYAIHPIHGEGGAVWKELSALKEVVRELQHDMKCSG